MESAKKLRQDLGEDEEIDTIDRLSSLPDSLIGHILSDLSFTSAVATSVLSRRWRHLWTQVTKLHLSWYLFSKPFISRYSRCINEDGFERLFSAMACVLRNQTLLNFQHVALDLHLPSDEPPLDYCYSLLDAFVQQICGPKVETSMIDITYSPNNNPPAIPPCIFQCQSLVSLALCNKFHILLPNDGVISLPNLKKLHMSFYDSSRELTTKLFSFLPMVEDLKLDFNWLEGGHFVDISCPNLQKLVIHKGRYSEGSKFHIDAPKLENFDLTDGGLSIYSFVECPSGLLKAEIHVERDIIVGEPDDSSRMLKLLHGISNVRSLTLRGPIFYPFEYRDVRTLPIFPNLTYLHHFGDNACIWKGMAFVLSCSPNLAELDIYNFSNKDTSKWIPLASAPACLMDKLKIVRIDGLRESEDQMQMVQYILGTAKVLELISVDLAQSSKSKEMQLLHSLMFCEKLFKFPRSSSACEIKFQSSYLRASSTDFKEGSRATLDCRILF